MIYFMATNILFNKISNEILYNKLKRYNYKRYLEQKLLNFYFVLFCLDKIFQILYKFGIKRLCFCSSINININDRGFLTI